MHLNVELRIDRDLESVCERIGVMRRRHNGQQLLMLRLRHAALEGCRRMRVDAILAVVRNRNGNERTNDFVVAWVNEYGPKKTRVFSTTIGHNTATVEDTRYLDLLTRGVLWATGHLKEDGSAAEGYGKVAK